MVEFTSCGILLFKDEWKKFLLMKHKDRWDLPKGHIEEGETLIECAIREFEEETGIKRTHIRIIPAYRFELIYFPRLKKYPRQVVKKHLYIYLAILEKNKDIKPTEHESFKWFKWDPPHKLQEKTINPLLDYTDKFFKANGKPNV